MEKTNVMRILDQKKIKYDSYYYGDTDAISGVEVATVLKQDFNQVFKTLITISNSKKHYVFMIPVALELDLKKCAKAVSEKSLSMILSKELLGVTGYIHGGCSPIGLKKQFPIIIDNKAKDFSSIIFSSGKIGYQVQVALADLENILPIQYADITE